MTTTTNTINTDADSQNFWWVTVSWIYRAYNLTS